MKQSYFLVGLIALSLSFDSLAQTLLFNQGDSIAPGGILCREHDDPAQAAFSTYGADDFTVPPGVLWKIDSIVVQGFYNQAAPAATPTRVTIYADSSGMPGSTVVFSGLVADGDIDDNGRLEPYFPEGIYLNPGTYWLSIGIETTATPWYWQRITELLTPSPMHWQNPGGGYALCNSWDALYTCITAVSDSSANFEIYGCINPPLNVSLSQGDTTFCFGEASITVAASSSTPGVDYLWNTGDSSNSITVDTGGVYTVTVTNPATGCGVPKSVNMNILPLPYYDVADVTTCDDFMPYTFIANPGNATVTWPDGSTGLTETISVPGTYVVTYNGNNGCVGSDTFELIVEDLQPVTSPLGPVDLCVGESFMAGVLGEYNSYSWELDSNSISSSDSLEISSGGVYSVIVTAANGCSGAAELVAVERPIPNATIQSQVTTGLDVQLFINGNFTSYEWSNGSTSSSIVVSQNGTYSVTVIDEFGCEGSASTTVNTVGIEDPIANQVTVYPNPARDNVSFTFPDTWIDNASVTIYDTQGRTVKAFEITSNNYALSLDQMSNGVYLIQFASPDGVGNTSLIVTE